MVVWFGKGNQNPPKWWLKVREIKNPRLFQEVWGWWNFWLILARNVWSFYEICSDIFSQQNVCIVWGKGVVCWPLLMQVLGTTLHQSNIALSNPTVSIWINFLQRYRYSTYQGPPIVGPPFVSFPYHSHTSYGILMGVVWEWGSHYWGSLEFPFKRWDVWKAGCPVAQRRRRPSMVFMEIYPSNLKSLGMVCNSTCNSFGSSTGTPLIPYKVHIPEKGMSSTKHSLAGLLKLLELWTKTLVEMSWNGQWAWYDIHDINCLASSVVIYPKKKRSGCKLEDISVNDWG